jgi:phosphoglucomutase
LRTSPITKINGLDVIKTTDYNEQTVKDANGLVTPLEGLPKSDVIKFNLADEKSQLIIRPSGTEPKIKFYLSSSQESLEKANEVVEEMLSDVKSQLGL